jgi:hypothetical protein
MPNSNNVIGKSKCLENLEFGTGIASSEQKIKEVTSIYFADD